MKTIATVPSLCAPIAERFKLGGLDAVPSDELIDALEELDIVKSELDDAQCQAASFEEDLETANCWLEEERDRSTNYAESLEKLDSILAAAVTTLDRISADLPDETIYPEFDKLAKLVDKLREDLTNARDECETEDY